MSDDLVRRGDVELLAELERTGAITATALSLDVRMSFDEYVALGLLLGRLSTAVRFWSGDYLLYGEACFGEEAAQASEALRLSEDGRMDAIRVSRMIPRRLRRESLSWWHHRIVAVGYLEPDEREELLDRAEREGWTTRVLEAVVRDLRRGGSDSRGATTAEPPIVVEALVDAARDLVRDARRGREARPGAARRRRPARC
jgi:hypothetical protein